MGRKLASTLIQSSTMPLDAKPSWSLAYKLELLILSFDDSWSKFAESSRAPNKKPKTGKELPSIVRTMWRKKKHVPMSSPKG